MSPNHFQLGEKNLNSVGASVGVSYNDIKYFSNELDLLTNTLTSKHVPGVPLGIMICRGLNRTFFRAGEYRYLIIAGHQPYSELRFLLAVAIL